MENNLDFLFTSLAAHEEAPEALKPSADQPLRTSSYTIYVDLPEIRDEMLLVHGYLGSHDMVSSSVAAWLRSMEPKRAPKPLYGVWKDERPDGEIAPPSDETISVLKQRGYLTRKTPAQEEGFFKAFARKVHEKNLKTSPSYIIMPTYNCNLRCPYCFQDHMRKDPNFKPFLKTMSHAMADRIFAGIPKIEEMHGTEINEERRRSFTFFGGEPLLEQSRPIVEYMMNKMFELGPANIHTISNATEIHAYKDLLGPELLSSIQVTLDGTAEEHDKRRIYPDGSGSFSKIMGNIDMALERNVKISVRLNLDRNNIGDLPEIVENVISHGWHKHPKFNIYAAPIRSDKKSPEIMNAWELVQEMEKLKQDYPDVKIVGRPDDALRNKARMMFKEPGSEVFSLKPVFCTAHNRMYIFDAFGDIYACWEKTGDKRIRIGHLTDEGEVKLNAPLNIEWRTRTVASNPVCSKCRYALHCGGGCAVLAEGRTGKLHSNFCDGYAARFRSVLAEAYLSSNMANQPV